MNEVTTFVGIVSDTGPLISWARAGHIGLLRDLVEKLVLPQSVVQELQKPGRPGSQLLSEIWITEGERLPEQALVGFPSVLGNGEKQAIALAQRLEVMLLVDDSSARKEAERRGIICLSTLRLLAQAKQEGKLNEVAPLLQAFRNEGFWLSDSVARLFLARLGEA